MSAAQPVAPVALAPAAFVQAGPALAGATVLWASGDRAGRMLRVRSATPRGATATRFSLAGAAGGGRLLATGIAGTVSRTVFGVGESLAAEGSGTSDVGLVRGGPPTGPSASWLRTRPAAPSSTSSTCQATRL